MLRMDGHPLLNLRFPGLRIETWGTRHSKEGETP
jgi:hypothetical protein